MQIFSQYWKKFLRYARNTHPNIVAFLATFSGVLAATIIANFEQSIDEKSYAKNITLASYKDCRNTRNVFLETKDNISVHLNLETDETEHSLFFLIERKFESCSKQEDCSNEVYDYLKTNIIDTNYDISVYNQIPNPALMIDALIDNISIHSHLPPEILNNALALLPKISGSSGSYNNSISKLDFILHNRERQVESINLAMELAPTNEYEIRKNRNLALDAIEVNYQNLAAEEIINALYSFEDFSDHIFAACYWTGAAYQVLACNRDSGKFLDDHNKFINTPDYTLGLPELECRTTQNFLEYIFG